MDLGLNGRRVLVTGGGGSIGMGLARGFSREGSRLFLIDTNRDTLEETGHAIEERGGFCQYRTADVTRADDVTRAVSEAVEVLGGGIDVLVNAAGIVRMGRVDAMSEGEWDGVFDVNCKGTFLFIREVVPFMERNHGGTIVNFSSKSGKTGSALLSAYSAAKAAIIGLTQALAYELSPSRIRVNCICPGLVEETGIGTELFEEYAELYGTSMAEVMQNFQGKVPLGRLAAVEDIVDMVLFLASERSSYMTGQAINVSGGREMH
jgi:NAD(P)-dependent dehydrogenase (short-subunit alcohol dehydrogenase family)